MKHISQIYKTDAKKIKYILHDIDDTITTNGKLTKNAYSALWDLHDAGYKVIPVTGRPAGWCDMIIRQWPVDAVVSENGAFVYYFENNKLKTFKHPLATDDAADKLNEIKKAVLKEIPDARISKDQFARIYDLAIDFNEDPPYLGFEVADKIKKICESFGAIAKVSSIHVNTWFGDYNKLDMTKLFFKNILHEDDFNEKCIFFGDSPNDAPMLEFFKNSCAVANIKPFLGDLKQLPAYITQNSGGEGFYEGVNTILKLSR